MSLDLWLESDECSECTHIERTERLNHTYNCSAMWYQIYPNQKHFVDIDGLTGKESLPLLQTAIMEMTRKEKELTALNPENGWGSYESLKVYLISLLNDAIRHPGWKWRSCR